MSTDLAQHPNVNRSTDTSYTVFGEDRRNFCVVSLDGGIWFTELHDNTGVDVVEHSSRDEALKAALLGCGVYYQ